MPLIQFVIGAISLPSSGHGLRLSMLDTLTPSWCVDIPTASKSTAVAVAPLAQRQRHTDEVSSFANG